VKFFEQRGDSVRHEIKMQHSGDKSLSNTAVKLTFILGKEVLTTFGVVRSFCDGNVKQIPMKNLFISDKDWQEVCK